MELAGHWCGTVFGRVLDLCHFNIGVDIYQLYYHKGGGAGENRHADDYQTPARLYMAARQHHSESKGRHGRGGEMAHKVCGEGGA